MVANSGWAPCSVLSLPHGEGRWEREHPAARGHGEDPATCCAWRCPGFRLSSHWWSWEDAAQPPRHLPSPKTALEGGKWGSPCWELAAVNPGAVPETSCAGAPHPHGASGTWGRSSVQSSVLPGSRDMGVGFPQLQQHCSCRVLSRTLISLLKSDQFDFKI